MKSVRKLVVGASAALMLASVPVSTAQAADFNIGTGGSWFSILAGFFSSFQGQIDPFQGQIDPF